MILFIWAILQFVGSQYCMYFYCVVVKYTCILYVVVCLYYDSGQISLCHIELCIGYLWRHGAEQQTHLFNSGCIHWLWHWYWPPYFWSLVVRLLLLTIISFAIKVPCIQWYSCSQSSLLQRSSKCEYMLLRAVTYVVQTRISYGRMDLFGQVHPCSSNFLNTINIDHNLVLATLFTLCN